MSSSFDGFEMFRAWQREKNSLTVFAFGGPSSFGRFDTVILSVDSARGGIGLDIPDIPLASFSLDFSGAEFGLIEADEVPSDFPISFMGIDGYSRFLSVRLPNRALFFFAERSTHL
jgi:hypothetical protein